MTNVKKMLKLWKYGYKDKSLNVIAIILIVFGLALLIGIDGSGVNFVAPFIIFCAIHQLGQPIINYNGTGIFKNSPLYKWYQTKGTALFALVNAIATFLIVDVVYFIRWNINPEIRAELAAGIILGILLSILASLAFVVMYKIWWVGMVFCFGIGAGCGFTGFFSGFDAATNEIGENIAENGFNEGLVTGMNSVANPGNAVINMVSGLPFWSLILITIAGIIVNYLLVRLVSQLFYKLPIRANSLSVKVREMQ